MPKLTAAAAREILPAAIADFALELCKAGRTRALSFQHRASVYLDEDQRYTAFAPDGRNLGSVKVGGEWGGVENAGLIAKDMKLPAGAYVVERQLFLGKVFVTVYHNNGQQQVTA